MVGTSAGQRNGKRWAITNSDLIGRNLQGGYAREKVDVVVEFGTGVAKARHVVQAAFTWRFDYRSCSKQSLFTAPQAVRMAQLTLI